MLLASAWVLDRYVDNNSFPAEKPAGASIKLKIFEERVTFEDVEAPRGGRWWKAGFWGFVIFKDDGCIGYSVGFCGEEASRGVIWLLFFYLRWGVRFYYSSVGVKGGLLRGKRGFGAFTMWRMAGAAVAIISRGFRWASASLVAFMPIFRISSSVFGRE